MAWMFLSAQSVNKIEILQKRALHVLCDVFKHPTEEGGKSTMNVRRLRTLCVEIYKTLSDLNQIFMNNVL